MDCWWPGKYGDRLSDKGMLSKDFSEEWNLSKRFWFW